MKDREIYSGLAAAPPVFIRLDGRSFHQLASRLALLRPFDPRFSEAMSGTCVRLMAGSGLTPRFCYTFSDEISIYLMNLPFGGRVEKLDSVAASYAASALTLVLGSTDPVSFDSRIVQVSPDIAWEYLAGRQHEAWRNHINAYAQESLVRDGLSMREAADRLRGIPAPGIHEIAFAHGINLAKTPSWQRRGILVYPSQVQAAGENPLTGERVETTRSRIVVDRDPPLFHLPEGKELIRRLISGE